MLDFPYLSVSTAAYLIQYFEAGKNMWLDIFRVVFVLFHAVDAYSYKEKMETTSSISTERL
jgi:amino acid permease